MLLGFVLAMMQDFGEGIRNVLGFILLVGSLGILALLHLVIRAVGWWQGGSKSGIALVSGVLLILAVLGLVLILA